MEADPALRWCILAVNHWCIFSRKLTASAPQEVERVMEDGWCSPLDELSVGPGPVGLVGID